MRKRRFIVSLLFSLPSIFLLFLGFDVLFPLPAPKPYSLVVQDRQGNYLHAFLADDGIWRLKTRSEDIPGRLKEILIQNEDRYFYYHPGINPISIVRALIQNVTARRTVSGASTITMQVARMLERKERTYTNKLFEMFRAFQLEWQYSKDEILNLYLSMVPLGGNIEGLESGSLLYYQTPLERLNIAQVFDLILIPKDPNRLRPDRGSQELYEERTKSALPWISKGSFSRQDSVVLWATSSGVRRKPLPAHAPHFSLRIRNQGKRSGTILTSLDIKLQKSAEKLLTNHLLPWKSLGVQSGAVIVIDNKTMEVVAYIGSPDFADSAMQGQVDAVRAIRSPGSTMKPILCALEIERGRVTPKTRLLDVPYDVDGYTAENYDGTFSGLVCADDALRRSLNVPFVRLLSQTGVKRFLDFLPMVGILSPETQRDNLGLSLILGGIGISLEELAGAYATFANGGVYRRPAFLRSEKSPDSSGQRVFSTSTAFLITDILSGLDRPDLPNNFESSINLPRVAFKTGTSYGRRDAWGIGYSSEYTIGVWIGNMSNKGSADLVGSKSAAPLLIDLFNSISSTNRKNILPIPPDVSVRSVCALSGKLPTNLCRELVQEYYSVNQTLAQYCDVEKEYFVSLDGTKHYCSSCVANNRFKSLTYSDYPPELLAFWKKSGVSYEMAPPHNPACDRVFAGSGPTIMSPSNNVTYYFAEAEGKIALHATSGVDVREHRWYVDNRFLRCDKAGQRLFVSLKAGKHRISCLDEKGRITTVQIQVHYMI